MLFDEQLVAYFRRGTIQSHTYVRNLTFGLVRDGDVADLNEVIKDRFSPEIASQLIGKDRHDRVQDAPTTWDENNEPHEVSVGFFLYAIERNWETGIISGELYDSSIASELHIFHDREEHLLSEFDEADFEFTLSGLCFDFSTIEMLLPTHQLASDEIGTRTGAERRGPVGRPPKWDWDAALESLIARAQLPDGLPSGAGAQAEIERLIASWFMETENDCPSESQIRGRAQRVMRAIANGRKVF